MILTPAVFLDRDGVLVREVNLLTHLGLIDIFTDVPHALQRLKEAGFKLPVVSNQTGIARGILSEEKAREIQREIESQIATLGGPLLDGFYFCPHHPSATLAIYCVDCECRKPKPGMILQAAKDLNIDLTKSFMIGDRISDIHAGFAAGVKTILVETGAHLDPPITTTTPMDLTLKPDFQAHNLTAAVDWIIGS